MREDKIRTWRRNGFTLELWDTNVPTGTGRLAHTLLAFRFSDRGRVIFAGDNFVPPLGVAVDSDDCVSALMFWLALQPGDADEEFFEKYTPMQREWLESVRPDDLSSLAREMESR